jgi:hypothetical protein
MFLFHPLAYKKIRKIRFKVFSSVNFNNLHWNLHEKNPENVFLFVCARGWERKMIDGKWNFWIIRGGEPLNGTKSW